MKKPLILGYTFNLSCIFCDEYVGHIYNYRQPDEYVGISKKIAVLPENRGGPPHDMSQFDVFKEKYFYDPGDVDPDNPGAEVNDIPNEKFDFDKLHDEFEESMGEIDWGGDDIRFADDMKEKDGLKKKKMSRKQRMEKKHKRNLEVKFGKCFRRAYCSGN